MAKKNDENKDPTFNIINKNTVERLKREGKVDVPAKKVDVPKDKRWNEKQMGSKILQGILGGHSVQKMSESMKEVVDNNMNSAVRQVRTMTTSAECNGRLDSYRELASKGVVLKKVWIATPDHRTRESHLEIDGQEVEIEDLFGNGCMFPGDAKAAPEEVWNCRCTMRSHILGVRLPDGSIEYTGIERDETSHDRQMDAEKDRREKAENKKVNKPITKPNKQPVIKPAKKVIMTNSLKDAIKAYTAKGGQYATKYPYTAEKRSELSKALNSNIIRLDKELYRGIDFSESEWERIFNEWYGGKEVKMRMLDINSFTTNKTRSYAYGGTGTHATLILRKGETVHGLDIGKHSIYKEEEVLVSGIDDFIIDDIQFKSNGSPLIFLKRKSKKGGKK